MTTIISVVNHKGGCLKTTVTANLGAALARVGKRVLLIDLDAQQNLTQSLIGPVEFQDGTPTLYDALVDETGLDHLITPTPTKIGRASCRERGVELGGRGICKKKEL